VIRLFDATPPIHLATADRLDVLKPVDDPKLIPKNHLTPYVYYY